MISFSIALMLIGLSGIIIGSLIRAIIRFCEAWKAGFEKDVIIELMCLIPMFLIAVCSMIYIIYK